ncbi:hypothetical protein scyTo_0000374 [Scyliorhinus torazame]|uniref:WH2 domain-containing protein n=1 Tax=Scyliorhinus torazame TaxID=75743 RepID=A0A401NW33_SCYTO|nr:hypothetical protein [Scyliorhinus torazame]
MPIPPPPPPPPAAPPPPLAFSQSNAVTPKMTRDDQRNRGALLNDITKGAKLRKVTNANDRSAPIIENAKGGGGGGGGGFGAGPLSGGRVTSMGSLFQGGVPKLRPVGHRDNSDSTSSKTALNLPGTRSAAPRPPSSSNRYSDDSDSQSKTSPPELPRVHRPSLPDLSSTSRPSSAGGLMRGVAPPPPSPSPSQNRPPPPARDPPNRGAAPPPPPLAMRNGAREVPPPPPPYRTPSSDPPNRGKPPPPPPMRTPAPPPPPIRNGHRDPVGSSSKSFTDDFESKYSFHPIEDFPAPEEYHHFQKMYPSKLNRAVRGAPPLPPVAR